MRHKWSEVDDRVIARYMALFETPTCFKRSAEALGVTEKSVRCRYNRRKLFIQACTLNYIAQTCPLLNNKSELKKLSIWTLIGGFFKKIILWKRR